MRREKGSSSVRQDIWRLCAARSRLWAIEDIYGLGVIFYKALTQELPYQGDNIVSLLPNQMNGSPALLKLEGYTDDQPIALQRFFEEMTQVNPASRLQTAKEVVERAKALLIDSSLLPYFSEK